MGCGDLNWALSIPRPLLTKKQELCGWIRKGCWIVLIIEHTQILASFALFCLFFSLFPSMHARGKSASAKGELGRQGAGDLSPLLRESLLSAFLRAGEEWEAFLVPLQTPKTSSPASRKGGGKAFHVVSMSLLLTVGLNCLELGCMPASTYTRQLHHCQWSLWIVPSIPVLPLWGCPPNSCWAEAVWLFFCEPRSLAS